MDAKRIDRAETVFAWKALVMCQLYDASPREVEYAETFLRIPPAFDALYPIKAAA